MTEKKEKKQFFDTKLLRRVFQYTRPYRGSFYTSVFLAIFLAVISPVRPLLIQQTVNDYIRNDALQMLFWITAIQVGVLIIETVARFFFSFITSALGQNVVRDLRRNVFGKVLRLNLSQYDRTPIGTLTTRTINDIESINDIFADGLIPIISDLLTILFVLGTMFWVDWRLTLVCLIPFPILIIATYFFKESVNKSFHKVRNAVAALNAFVQEHITGMGIVQAFASEEREMNKFVQINKDHRNANIRAIFAYSVFFPVVEIISALSIGLLVWWGATQVAPGVGAAISSNGADALAGNLIAFILYINQIFRPLRVIADKFNVIQMGMIASERVFKLMDNPDVTEDEGTHAPATVKGKIEFDKVWFAYEAENYVLKDVNFKVNPGETLAIVGHTGSGKTSIISLLNRLYHINKGSILIDDVSIEAYKLDALRSRIGVVLQDVFLFSGTVLDNLTLRNPDIPFERVEAAAKLIGLHEFILQLPGGYHYNVMERGNTLSMGQRQLMSFARALLYDPSILILDEATSSVDTESEHLIQHAIDTLIAGRTAIVIAHRLSTIRKADKILVLDKGVIKEMGSHEELMAQGGYYAGLVEMQFGTVSAV
ncbi:ABC transporter ATP-binding protein [Parasegetibacter sp. NRK P23]|uniref:ABC transporter ATP-binding protein n=1 Tax=Parasegetibacter sp. NRK P23 TaxID=2942999 RepID=UPI002043ACE4|nr:ABC transporter ATP-binding protein [Parasegetibacter sp. NRK P23]MCM5529560.1 ABC transporter ATP-binding protein/permease [Parasegetibacter sp. NRK P23]